MSALLQPPAHQDRRIGVGAGANYVCSQKRRLRKSRFHAQVCRLSAEYLFGHCDVALSGVPSSDADISDMDRTRGMATAWALAWTPVPRMASVAASGRASRRVARADPAAVRMAVMCSPSMMAAGLPVRVEDGDEGLVAGYAQFVVVGEDADELDRESFRGWQVGGHDQQVALALAYLRRDSRGLGHVACADICHRRREGVD